MQLYGVDQPFGKIELVKWAHEVQYAATSDGVSVRIRPQAEPPWVLFRRLCGCRVGLL